jgi:hypothetical protein
MILKLPSSDVGWNDLPAAKLSGGAPGEGAQPPGRVNAERAGFSSYFLDILCHHVASR